MRCRYELRLRSICPVNDGVDQYEVIIETTQEIRVEDLLDLVEHYRETKATQEEITQRLVKDFDEEVTVTTVGYHSGVKTTVICP